MTSDTPIPGVTSREYTVQLRAEGLELPVATIKVRYNQETGVMRVWSADASVPGKGLGRRAYAAAIDKAKSLGAKQFASDKRVSDSAARAWESMQRRGLPVNRARSTNDGMQFISQDGGPVFSVNLSGVSQRTIANLAR